MQKKNTEIAFHIAMKRNWAGACHDEKLPALEQFLPKYDLVINVHSLYAMKWIAYACTALGRKQQPTSGIRLDLATSYKNIQFSLQLNGFF